MNLHKLTFLLTGLGLVACSGGEKDTSNAADLNQQNDGSTEEMSTTAGEPETSKKMESINQAHATSTIDPTILWDTKLAYGYAAKTPATGIERGKQVYEQWCIICHGAGVGMAGTESLARKYKDYPDIPALLPERENLYPEVTKTFVRNGVKSMPYFRKTEISDEDLELLAAYLARNIEE